MKQFRVIIICLYLIILCGADICGQNKKHPVWRDEKYLFGVRPQVESEFPDGFGYRHIDVYIYEYGEKRKQEALVSKDGDFVLIYSVNHFPITPDDSLLVTAFGSGNPPRSMNDYFWNRVEKELKYVMGDKYRSLEESPITYYSRKSAKKKFNADRAISYRLEASKEKPLELDMDYCRVIVLQKNGRGWICMYCYYNDDMPRKKLKSYIKTVEGIFRYRDPEEFVDYSNEEK